MQKKYIVRLTEEERQICQAAIDNLSGRSQKARRARILLQVDVDGPGWPDRQAAECRLDRKDRADAGSRTAAQQHAVSTWIGRPCLVYNRAPFWYESDALYGPRMLNPG